MQQHAGTIKHPQLYLKKKQREGLIFLILNNIRQRQLIQCCKGSWCVFKANLALREN